MMEKLVKLGDKSFRQYKSESEIQVAVKNIADKINNDYIGKRPILVPVLNGSFLFAADLFKELKLDCEITFVKAASYKGTANGSVSTLIGLTEDITGRHIIILEDVVDSGQTLAQIIPDFKKGNPASIKVASLALKSFALKADVEIDYVGIEITNEFIVGYGLDYNGLGRNLRDIYQEVEE